MTSVDLLVQLITLFTVPANAEGPPPPSSETSSDKGAESSSSEAAPNPEKNEDTPATTSA